MFTKRITLFAGHYGSGKTNVSVNYAISLAKQNKKVYIYDMDIVNPYFRTIDAKSLLDKFGVEIVVSPFAETNVDIPAMNSASYKMVDDVNSFAVVDIGGDKRRRDEGGDMVGDHHEVTGLEAGIDTAGGIG
ncbi:MAG: hypothetical protein IKA99_02855, partial [Clostridia bacterium]|nr:hypothetical protein [Clostridia bacterium]